MDKEQRIPFFMFWITIWNNKIKPATMMIKGSEGL